MRVVDTSIWIELVAKGTLLAQARQAVMPLATCIVPAMVQYELTKWCRRVLRPEDAQPLFSLLTECVSVQMDSIIATDAAGFSLEYKLHATDAIIYATARLHNAPLFTCDAHFKGLPGVEYYEKPER